MSESLDRIPDNQVEEEQRSGQVVGDVELLLQVWQGENEMLDWQKPRNPVHSCRRRYYNVEREAEGTSIGTFYLVLRTFEWNRFRQVTAEPSASVIGPHC